MARRPIKYPPPKPWKPDAARWLPFLRQEKKLSSDPLQLEPKGGWQLWDWKTYEDVKQNI